MFKEKFLYFILSTIKDEVFALKKVFNLKIGKNCRLKNNNYGSEPFLISIGDYVSAINVDFITHDGGVWLWRKEMPDIDLIKPIKIESNIFIGHKAIILPGTHIESNVIIGAGSVVKGRIISNKVYAGVPAKPICTIQEYLDKNKENFTTTKLRSYKEKKDFLINQTEM